MSGAGFDARIANPVRRAFRRNSAPSSQLGEADALPFEPDIAAAAGRCNKPSRGGRRSGRLVECGLARTRTPQGENQMNFSRRALLKASAASAVLGGIEAPSVARAQAAEFTYKYANNLPDAHPMNVRAKEMAAAIKTETNGRVDLQIFPNNQLGSDTDMLSQIRSGGIEFFTLSGLILATLVPAASISGIGFAFPDYDTVWKARHCELGACD